LGVCVQVEVVRARDKAEGRLGPGGVLGLCKVVFIPREDGCFEFRADVDNFSYSMFFSHTSGWVQEFFVSGDLDLGQWLGAVITESALDSSEALCGFQLFINDF
jgi:hypothetical protein